MPAPPAGAIEESHPLTIDGHQATAHHSLTFTSVTCECGESSARSVELDAIAVIRLKHKRKKK